MERPVHEIDGVIASLTQGDDQRQQATFNDYFTPDAYFVHPLCRVPSFSAVEVPFLGTFESRWFVHLIYRWYRILSPQIEFRIDSKAFDQQNNVLYVTMHQIFTLWVVPFSLWQAHVKLVTALELQQLPVGEDGRPISDKTRLAPGDKSVPRRYFIHGQEDNYQMTEWLKFIAPWGGRLIWLAGQLISTLVCSVCVYLFWPLSYVQPRGLQKKVD